MTRQIETDYLVVGAGASGMAFTDELVNRSDAEVVLVDRRHRPGGHWIDAYPFVRLHQPSACYGVNSRKLGNDRIDEVGPNAGFYERATPHEIRDYYTRVLEEQMLPSGQVRFLGMSDYRGSGADEHHVVSTLTGETTTVKVRRKLVDTTYTEGTIPSRHTPAFEVSDGVRLIPPNDLVDLGGAPSGYTVLGAGKTSMDTCMWLLDQGVSPDRIRWIRSRDVWAFDRSVMQPLDLMTGQVELFAAMYEAAAESSDPIEMMLALESEAMTLRLDESVVPQVFRGATLSRIEFEALRQISNVVRLGKVLRIDSDRVTLDGGTIASDPRQVYVDCTASAVKPVPARPIFESGRITTQMTTLGVIPWSAATVGYVEASHDDDDEKNQLCPPIPLTGELAHDLEAFYVAMKLPTVRMGDPGLSAWNESARLNPMGGMAERMGDPEIQGAFARMAASMQPALANMERILAQQDQAVSA